MKDITGQRFGKLTVLRFSQKLNKSETTWVCLCECGNTVIVRRSNLTSGNTKSCGCLHLEKVSSDLAGKRFGRLIALRPIEERANGFLVWECQCDCGNITKARSSTLVNGTIRSCGCLYDDTKKERVGAMRDNLTLVDGTMLDAYKNKKLQSNNTTGCTGVSPYKGKFKAGINFQGKRYHLGTFVDIKDAIAVRKKAETVLFDETLDYYERWKAKAEEDPQWARENPIQIKVDRVGDHDFDINFDPKI